MNVSEKKGRIPWNKGLTKFDHPSIMSTSIKMSGNTNPAKRQEVVKKIKETLNSKEWKDTKGKEKKRKRIETVNDEEWKNTIGEEKIKKMMEMRNSEEWKNTIGKDRIRKHKETINSEEWKDTVGKEMKEKMKKTRAKQILPVKDTSIEIKLQNLLKDLHIGFVTHKVMKIEHAYQCDIFIPSMNLVIEADGDYWHGNPEIYKDNILTDRQIKQKFNDKIRNKELIKKGYKILRLWGTDIRRINVDEFSIMISECVK